MSGRKHPDEMTQHTQRPTNIYEKRSRKDIAMWREGAQGKFP